jgi:hypothetical protein
VAHHQVYAWDDSYQYLQIAQNLPYFSQMNTFPYLPDLQRMPLYPIFLWLGGLNPVIILFMQFVIQTITAFFIFKVLSDHTRYAFYIAVAYWIMPNSVLFSVLILTECLFVFFMILGMYYVQRQKWIQANICVVMSIFTRPNSILILFILLLLGSLYMWKKKASKKLIIQFIMGLTISFLCVFGWMYRNYTICQQWKLSVLSDNTLIHGRLGGLMCYQKKLLYTDDNLVCQSEAYLIEQKVIPFKKYYSPIHRQETEIYVSEAHKMAYRYILKNLPDYILFQGECAIKLFQGMGYKSWLTITENKWLSMCLAIFQAMYTLICIVVFLRAFISIKNLKLMQFLVLLSITAMLILALLPYADTRYRFPTDSLIFLLFVDWNKKK